MKLFVRAIFIVLFVTWQQHVSALAPLAIAAAVTSIVSGAITLGLHIKNIVSNSYRYLGAQPQLQNNRELNFNTEFNNLIDHLMELQRLNHRGFISISFENLLQQTLQSSEICFLKNTLNEFFIKSTKISQYYDDTVAYLKNLNQFDREILIENALLMVLKTPLGVENLIREINIRLVGNPLKSETVLGLFKQHGKAFLEKAGILQSQQQFLKLLLDYYILTEIKAFYIISYSYYILERLKSQEGVYESLIDKAGYEFAIRLNESVASFQTAMFSASTEFYRFNPLLGHAKDETYTELEGIFQKYVVNEVNLNADASCRSECKDYTEVSNATCDRQEAICSHASCEGKLYDCGFVIDTRAYICPAQNGSGRKYDYINYANGNRYGQQSFECSQEVVTSEARVDCNQCMCTCADKSVNSDRFICTQLGLTDVLYDYVLTGVQIVKHNHTIYLQAQEGRLLPNGSIQKNTTRWIPIDYKCKNFIRELDWKKLREVNLRHESLSEGKVLVGLAFSVEDNRIGLMGYGVYFNVSIGKMWLKKGSEMIDTASRYNGTELKLNDRDIPTREKLTSIQQRTNADKYVKLQTSSLHEDVGQSTIPFLDIQPVTPDPPLPLTGFGLYHKGQLNDGGFIGVNLFTYDFTKLLWPDLPANFDVHQLRQKRRSRILSENLDDD